MSVGHSPCISQPRLLSTAAVIKRRVARRHKHTQCVCLCPFRYCSPPKVLEIGKTTMVVSVPRELSSDHSAVLLLAESSGRITEADISERLQWAGSRPRRVLDELMQVCTYIHMCSGIFCTRYLAKRSLSCRLDLSATACALVPMRVLLTRCMRVPLKSPPDSKKSRVLVCRARPWPTGRDGVGGWRRCRTRDGGRRWPPGVLLPKPVARRALIGRRCRDRINQIHHGTSP